MRPAARPATATARAASPVDGRVGVHERDAAQQPGLLGLGPDPRRQPVQRRRLLDRRTTTRAAAPRAARTRSTTPTATRTRSTSPAAEARSTSSTPPSARWATNAAGIPQGAGDHWLSGTNGRFDVLHGLEYPGHGLLDRRRHGRRQLRHALREPAGLRREPNGGTGGRRRRDRLRGERTTTTSGGSSARAPPVAPRAASRPAPTGSR